MQHPNSETERFILRILTPELVSESYLSWFSDQEASRHIYYAKNKVTIESLKQYVLEKLNSEDTLFFGIFDKKNHEHLGNIKYEPIDLKMGYAVMGVMIGNQDWRGRGVFSEVDQVLNLELKKLGVQTIYLGVDKENISAIKAYNKSGFSVDELDFLNVQSKNSITMKKVIA